MRLMLIGAIAIVCNCLGAWAAPTPLPVLKQSDVIFMNQAGRQIYQEYGATVLAWGGTPRPSSIEAAAGMKFFGSVGMVTEFSRYFERFPTNYQEGLCRDLKGEPYKVPWLTDHQHKGVPYWWCCTRQPLFRQYITERVVETVKAGAYGVHIDDHLGTAGSLFVDGGCFCTRCAEGFREELKKETPAGVENVSTFDYPGVLRSWLAGGEKRTVTGHPLWPRWRAYQLRGAAQFMADLRELAARTAGRAVPMSANAGLLWGPHLNDFHTLDFFSAEIEHHAPDLKFSAAPVVGYRMADAVGRPLASTASGWDWAFVKERNLPGLVQGWIALSYASGHSLMAPHRQWCYTKEKGTHWYDGPKEKFAPLYRFVRANADLFDSFETHADLAIAYAQRTYDRNPASLMRTCERLGTNNISFTLALGGDDVVVHPLPSDPRGRAPLFLVLEAKDFSSGDRQALDSVAPARRVDSLDEALTKVKPAVRVGGNAPLRVFPRVKTGMAVIHILNWNYVAEKDGVDPVSEAVLSLDLAALGVPAAREATLFSPDRPPVAVPLQDGRAILRDAGLWSVLAVRATNN